MGFKEVEGDLIKLAKQGKFDVIAHGCNCFCVQGAGIAKQMAKEFKTNTFKLEESKYKGDFNKLGCIDFKVNTYTGGSNEFDFFEFDLTVVNCYTQFYYGRSSNRNIDYDALSLCLKKINHTFKGKKIGLNQIGCGLAGGDWNTVRNMVLMYLPDCDVTVVNLK